MIGSVQWTVVQSWAEFRLQQDSNPGKTVLLEEMSWPYILIVYNTNQVNSGQTT